MEQILTSQFWIGLGMIIWVNIILSGDNAVVIALAARSLPERQQKQAILWGAGAAVVLRIVLTIVAVKLLQFPYLKLVGGAALLWIAVNLLVPEDGDDDVKSSSNMLGAIRTILIADLVMSTDNVIAVAAVAKDSIVLLVLGLTISIPLVIFGATLLMKLMERYPVIVTLGAAVLGWTAGEMGVTDPAVVQWVNDYAGWLHWGAPIFGAVLVVMIGKSLASRAGAEEAPVPEVAALPQAAAAPQVQPTMGGGVMKVLIPVDGSDNSLRTAGFVIRQAPYYREPLEIHLLNVQHPFPGTIRGVAEEAKRFHDEEGAKALAGVRQTFDTAGLKCTHHVIVGDAAETIAHFVKSNHIDMVVMGYRGASAVANMLLGSVATKVLHLVEVPVLLVK